MNFLSHVRGALQNPRQTGMIAIRWGEWRG
jgi:hypothetical protein